jgi:hypothetical protein
VEKCGVGELSAVIVSAAKSRTFFLLLMSGLKRGPISEAKPKSKDDGHFGSTILRRVK